MLFGRFSFSLRVVIHIRFWGIIYCIYEPQSPLSYLVNLIGFLSLPEKLTWRKRGESAANSSSKSMSMVWRDLSSMSSDCSYTNPRHKGPMFREVREKIAGTEKLSCLKRRGWVDGAVSTCQDTAPHPKHLEILEVSLVSCRVTFSAVLRALLRLWLKMTQNATPGPSQMAIDKNTLCREVGSQVRIFVNCPSHGLEVAKIM